MNQYEEVTPMYPPWWWMSPEKKTCKILFFKIYNHGLYRKI